MVLICFYISMIQWLVRTVGVPVVDHIDFTDFYFIHAA